MTGVSAMLRIPKETHAVIQELAAQNGVSMQEIVRRAVKDYRRNLLIHETVAGYRALQADRDTWKQHADEQAVFENAVSDGLEDLGDEDELAAMWAEMYPDERPVHATT